MGSGSNGLERLDTKVAEIIGQQSVPMNNNTLSSSGIANTKNVVYKKYLLVDTKPDYNIEWCEAYKHDSWKDAYEHMIHIMLEDSSDNIEQNLINSNAVINPYSAQTFDKDGVRHVYHIVGI